MDAIQYKGALYTKTSNVGTPYIQHKRCEAGTHWNAKEKKCMKLPPEVAEASSHANHLSSLKSGLAKEHHHTCVVAHRKARAAANKHGFYDLAHHHEKRVDYHKEKRK